MPLSSKCNLFFDISFVHYNTSDRPLTTFCLYRKISRPEPRLKLVNSNWKHMYFSYLWIFNRTKLNFLDKLYFTCNQLENSVWTITKLRVDATLHKIPNFYLIFWCGRFRRVSCELLETLQKIYVSIKFIHWNIK